MEPVFNSKHHPDLVDVPLKGKWLEEFALCLDEQVEHFNRWLEMSYRMTPPMRRGEVGHVYDEVAQEVREIAAGIREEIAGKNGRDMSLEHLQRLFVRLQRELRAENTRMANTNGQRNDVAQDSERVVNRNDLYEQLLREFLMPVQQDFCEALALQQGREADYLKLLSGFNRHALDYYKEILDDSDPQGKESVLSHIALNMASAREIATLRKRRHSPLAEMAEIQHTGRRGAERVIDYGDESIMRQCVEHAHGLDVIDRVADRETFKRLLSGYYAGAMKMLGLDVNAMSAMGLG